MQSDKEVRSREQQVTQGGAFKQCLWWGTSLRLKPPHPEQPCSLTRNREWHPIPEKGQESLCLSFHLSKSFFFFLKILLFQWGHISFIFKYKFLIFLLKFILFILCFSLGLLIIVYIKYDLISGIQFNEFFQMHAVM